MKNKEIFSAAIGGAFFAIPYLALSAPLLPSLVIGAAAFGAGQLVLGENKLTLKDTNRNLYETLEYSKRQNKHILEMIPNIEDESIKKELNEIHDSVSKIINTISKNPEKVKQANNFFDYYLPITIKLIDRYDEIENQKLSSSESAKFLKSTNKMVSEINSAYRKILSELYRKDILDMDVEMKVFDSLLKADGIDSSDLKVKKEEEHEK
ncbi:MAG: 5-bromo-4-chloroindolyl phosphate hydrolysis family protein [Bacilli bacterium]|nr:5-bromo-4-chloroindolyl phosphate hydrolysis family protein [Bacilli bacterium]